jgi:hypothetical protein
MSAEGEEVADHIVHSNEPASVTVAGQPATVSPSGTFERGVPVTTGANVVTVEATDAAGNTSTAAYQVTVGSSTKSFTSDANGNLIGDGTRIFDWDALNQLVGATSGSEHATLSTTETVIGGNRF